MARGIFGIDAEHSVEENIKLVHFYKTRTGEVAG